nr:MAG TPA: putative transposase [Caudoviricetes sp.]
MTYKVQKIFVNPRHALFKALDNYAFLAKNLYNSTLYRHRQDYKAKKKKISWMKLVGEFASNNKLDSNQINSLVIGYNQGWKQDINLGKKVNQKFELMPFYKFLDMLKYKCITKGITVKIQEESYTSKCSFLDNEEVCKHVSYLGKRVKRGLFRSSTGAEINADINGAYNILVKAIGKFNYRPIQVCGLPSTLRVESK